MGQTYPCVVIHLYFQEGLASVPNYKKLQSAYVGDKVTAWIKHFLTGIKQRVLHIGQASEWLLVTSGVSQRSVVAKKWELNILNRTLPMTQNWVKRPNKGRLQIIQRDFDDYLMVWRFSDVLQSRLWVQEVIILTLYVGISVGRIWSIGNMQITVSSSLEKIIIIPCSGS